MTDVSVEYGYRHKTLSSYMVGLFGSFVLTVLAFGLIYEKILTDVSAYVAVAALAIIQLVVQSVFFLRLNATPSGRWNLFPFLFVLMIIVFLVGGSLWIMYNLNYNMAVLSKL